MKRVYQCMYIAYSSQLAMSQYYKEYSYSLCYV